MIFQSDQAVWFHPAVVFSVLNESIQIMNSIRF